MGRFFQDDFRGSRSWNGHERNVLLRNEGVDADGKLRFSNVGRATGADTAGDSRGVAVADFDNDGDLDIVVNSNPGDQGKESVPVALLRNDIGAKRKWLAVDLQGTESNRDAVGAEVTIEVVYADPEKKPVRMLRQVTAGSSYASQNHGRLHFGLGDHAVRMKQLSVRWPSGQMQDFTDVEPNRLVRIVEGRQLQQTNLQRENHGK